MRVQAPALFLLERFVLEPCCAVCAACGVWMLFVEHWLSAALLLGAGAYVGWMTRKLHSEERRLRREIAEEGERENCECDVEMDESEKLAAAIIQSNVVLCILCLGLIATEHLPVLRSAVFVVLFSIVYPAAVSVFCLAGEGLVRRREKGVPLMPPRLRHRAAGPHRG